LSGDSAPHFTTIAAFVSGLGDDIARLFGQVLYLCDRQGLIGREMFAIDGVKLPSNASKARSGTRADAASSAPKGWCTSSAVTSFSMQLQPKRTNDFKDGVEARATITGERFVETFARQSCIARNL
jgi:hypothetical protein